MRFGVGGGGRIARGGVSAGRGGLGGGIGIGPFSLTGGSGGRKRVTGDDAEGIVWICLILMAVMVLTWIAMGVMAVLFFLTATLLPAFILEFGRWLASKFAPASVMKVEVFLAILLAIAGFSLVVWVHSLNIERVTPGGWVKCSTTYEWCPSGRQRFAESRDWTATLDFWGAHLLGAAMFLAFPIRRLFRFFWDRFIRTEAYERAQERERERKQKEKELKEKMDQIARARRRLERESRKKSN